MTLFFIWLKKQVLRTTNIIESVKTEKWVLPSLVIYLPDTTAPKDEILTITLVSNIGLWWFLWSETLARWMKPQSHMALIPHLGYGGK